MIKAAIFRLFYLYQQSFFINRGKFFIGNLIYRVFGDICIRVNTGHFLFLKSNSVSDLTYFGNNPSHERVLTIIKTLQEGQVFVDVGANVGYFSFYAAEKVGNQGKVFAFEPSKREFIRLLKGQLVNKFKNIITFPIAISDYSGFAELVVEEFHTGMNRLAGSQNINRGNEKWITPCDTLDKIMEDYFIDVLKIDVEGAELNVLQGAQKLLTAQRVGTLIIEITPAYLSLFNAEKEDIYQMLKIAGYKSMVNSNAHQYDEVFILNHGT